MNYASREQLEEVWGADFVSDLLPEDVNAGDAISGALARASAEIDTYLSARYTLPLTASPVALVSPCANIAVYMLAIRHTALTTSIEDRYKQTVDLLERIADGKAGLGADEPRVVSNDPDTATGGAFFGASRRLFSRDLP